MNIVTVVVTYNRKELLKECLDAIMSQTAKISKIILVDNNSNDGTDIMLKENGFMDSEKVFYHKLNKNIGGAGGFYEGIKKAKEYNPDWVWIMDDDTIPNKTCLEELCNSIDNIEDKISYLASSIYGINAECMNVPIINSKKGENGYQEWYRFLEYSAVKIKSATFVSLLFNIDAINKCGLPCKDYFIWGDDTEYTTRLTRYYGNAYMIGKSVAIHKRKGGKSLSIVQEEDKNRINIYFYMVRNALINSNAYEGKKGVFIQLLRELYHIIKIIFVGKYKLLKIKIILKGVFAYIFKQYDYKAFKNRFTCVE